MPSCPSTDSRCNSERRLHWRVSVRRPFRQERTTGRISCGSFFFSGRLKRPRDRWIVGVVVLAVQWQILDRYLGKFELWWRDAHQRLGEHAVDRSARKAANEIADFVLGHEYLHSTWWVVSLPVATSGGALGAGSGNV